MTWRRPRAHRPRVREAYEAGDWNLNTGNGIGNSRGADAQHHRHDQSQAGLGAAAEHGGYECRAGGFSGAERTAASSGGETSRRQAAEHDSGADGISGPNWKAVSSNHSGRDRAEASVTKGDAKEDNDRCGESAEAGKAGSCGRRQEESG